MASPQELHRFDAIINLPHPEPKRHPRMNRASRAAQFAPFAALTGYDEAVQETARQTTTRHELDEDTQRLLNTQLQALQEIIATHPAVQITYFQPDERKDGGAYLTIQGNLRKIDLYNRRLTLTDQRHIALDAISNIVIEAQ